jgi:hypothetical protein
MSGPCLCGDPYCGRCFPGQAATLAMEEAWDEHAEEAGLAEGTPAYAAAKRAWHADIEAAQAKDEALIEAYWAEQERADGLCPTCLLTGRHDPECSRGGDA